MTDFYAIWGAPQKKSEFYGVISFISIYVFTLLSPSNNLRLNNALIQTHYSLFKAALEHMRCEDA